LIKNLKRGKKSQDPWATESSSEEDEKPAPRKRGLYFSSIFILYFIFDLAMFC